MRNKFGTEFSDEEEETKLMSYHVYKSAAEIDYQLDGAVKNGNKLITVLDTLVKALHHLSAQRKEVWSGEIERCVCPPFGAHSLPLIFSRSLQSFTFSPCIIALCGGA